MGFVITHYYTPLELTGGWILNIKEFSITRISSSVDFTSAKCEIIQTEEELNKFYDRFKTRFISKKFGI